MDYSINFPNLHIHLEHVGKNFMIGDFAIAFYGVTICIAVLIGIALACLEAKRTGQNPEDYEDLAIYVMLSAIVGARLYYVAFQWEYYKNDLLSILNLRQGGLAIYGGIIAAVVAAFIYAKIKKKRFTLLVDTACPSLALGQAIGRWGNFFNREAFGQYSDGLFAMQIPVSAVRSSEITQQMWDHAEIIEGIKYIQVHPTFLYESMWNLGVFILLTVMKKYKKFEGELFIWYLIGYGCGRFWIESLRTDQLIIGNTGLPVSQLLAAVLVVGGLGLDVYFRKNKKRTI